MDFAERLIKLMDEKSISNYRLAKDLGIAESAVRSWRSGKTRPRKETLTKLALYLGVEKAWLIFGDEIYKGEEFVPKNAFERKFLEALRQAQQLGVAEEAFNYTEYLIKSQQNLPGVKQEPGAVSLPELESIGARMRYFREHIIGKSAQAFCLAHKLMPEDLDAIEGGHAKPSGELMQSIINTYHQVLKGDSFERVIDWLFEQK